MKELNENLKKLKQMADERNHFIRKRNEYFDNISITEIEQKLNGLREVLNSLDSNIDAYTKQMFSLMYDTLIKIGDEVSNINEYLSKNDPNYKTVENDNDEPEVNTKWSFEDPDFTEDDEKDEDEE